MSIAGLISFLIYMQGWYRYQHNVIYDILIIFFQSHLTTDLFVGIVEYPEHMNFLSGYIHHIIYVFINIISIYSKNSHIYTIFMVEEIPTFVLSIGSFHRKYRNDTLFGITFFLTRILYHGIFLYNFKSDYFILFFGSVALGLHVYWFRIWLRKYASYQFMKF